MIDTQVFNTIIVIRIMTLRSSWVIRKSLSCIIYAYCEITVTVTIPPPIKMHEIVCQCCDCVSKVAAQIWLGGAR